MPSSHLLSKQLHISQVKIQQAVLILLLYTGATIIDIKSKFLVAALRHFVCKFFLLLFIMPSLVPCLISFKYLTIFVLINN